MKPVLRALLGLALFLIAAMPAAASSARLIGPGGLCVGVAGDVAAGAVAVLEACSGAADQVWQMPPRGDHGPVYLGGLCLDRVGPSLISCATPGGVSSWNHGADGWLMTGNYGPEPTTGSCLEAIGPLGSPGALAVAPCSGEPGQIFFAEGHDAWTPRLATGTSTFLPIDTAFPSIRYGHSSQAFLRSENYGRTYATLELANPGDVFAVSPFNPYLVFRNRSGESTLDRSRDGGRSWTPLTFLPHDIYGNQPKIVLSKLDENRLYVYGLGHLGTSHDGGRTFMQRGFLPRPSLGETELIDLGGGVLVFLRVEACSGACEPQNVSLWHSADEGASWQPVLTAQAPAGSVRLVADPHREGELYLTVREAGAAVDTLWRSTDGGRTFAVSGELPSRDGQLVFDRYDSGRRYLFQTGGLWRQQGDGSWQTLPAPHAAAGASAGRMTDFGGGFLRISLLIPEATGARAVYFDSYDHGESFQRFDPLGYGPETANPLPVAVTGERGVLYYLDGDVLLRSADGGASWQTAGSGLAGALAVVADPRAAERVFALLPSGLELSEDGGASFGPVPGPAASATALLVFGEGFPVAERTVVVAAVLPSFQISKDGGLTWSALPAPRPTERFRQLLGNERVLFALSETGDLFRTYDEGETWDLINTAGANLVFGSGLLAYTVPHQATVRVSDDGGDTFADRHPPDLIGELVGLHIDERNHIYVAGYTTVLRSSDRGRTWQSLGRDLLTGIAPRYALATDAFDEGKLYHSGAFGLHLGRFSATPPLDLAARFEARVRWRDYLGQTGSGVAQALTRNSGLFWLFTAGRAEVSVKVLDGRAINGKFWVFLASMTDVELDLEVVDRITGEVWTYHNPLGRFLSFGDIEAFPRTESDPAATPPSLPGGELLGAASQVLIGGRFEVEVDWTAPDGAGSGQGRQLNAESAAFHFFDPTNVELIVNLLDGRPINGKFWVYFGSLSDVAYTVRIRDRVTGTVKTYANPAGVFASRGDMEAFD